MFSTMGLVVGPVVGSFVYAWVGYVNTFYFFTVFIGSISTVCVILLPSHLNHSQKSQEISFTPRAEVPDVGYAKILSNKRSFIAMFILSFAMICGVFIDPVLSIELISLGMDEQNTGLAFGTIGLAVVIGSPTAGLLSERIPIRAVMAIGLCIMSVSLFFTGPSQLFVELPDKIWIIFIGLFLNGLAGSMSYVPVTPEMIDANTEVQKDELLIKFKEQGYF